MKRPAVRALTAALATTSLCAQVQVADVGMTVDLGPTLPAFVGYDCGVFSCRAADCGSYGPGSVRNFKVYGAPQTPWVLAVGSPGACQAIPGVGNSLLMGTPITTVVIGVIGAAFPGSSCNQGMSQFQLRMPATVPTGLQLRFQHVGIGGSGAPAFGPAIDCTVL